MLIYNFVIVTEHLLLKWDIVKLFLSAGKEMCFSHPKRMNVLKLKTYGY